MSEHTQQTDTVAPARCTNIHRGHNGAKDSQCPHPAATGRKWCDKCLSRRANNRKQRIALGMCEACSEPAVSGKLRCPKHLQGACDRAKLHQEHRVREGLCVEYHGGPPPHATHGVRCEMCWFSLIGRSAFDVKSRPSGRALAPALRDLFYAQGGKCAYTGRELVPGTNASLDHKIPKALGGTNDLENLQWVETNVNRAKNALAEDEFLSMCRAVVQHMERNRGAVRPL